MHTVVELKLHRLGSKNCIEYMWTILSSIIATCIIIILLSILCYNIGLVPLLFQGSTTVCMNII